MKTVAALVVAALLMIPGVALAGPATDAALGLGAFAVFNQIISGTGIFAGVTGVPAVVAPRPVVVTPPPVYVAPPPPPVYYAPAPVVVAPTPVYVRPAPVYTYSVVPRFHRVDGHGHGRGAHWQRHGWDRY
jgi:hypothetical protein